MNSLPSSQEISKAMEEAVAINQKVKEKFNATVSFQLDNEDPIVLHAKKDGSTDGKPDLQVKTSLETLHMLLKKKITPQQAFMKGKLKVKGNMGLAMKLTMVLDATRKHMAQQVSRL